MKKPSTQFPESTWETEGPVQDPKAGGLLWHSSHMSRKQHQSWSGRGMAGYVGSQIHITTGFDSAYRNLQTPVAQHLGG